MDVLQLLAGQQATNRANFAQAQAERSELAATKPQQFNAQGRDANSGRMALSADDGEPQLTGTITTTNGLIQAGQAVRVNADGRTVAVDQKPAARPVAPLAARTGKTVGNLKLLFAITTVEGVQLWVAGWREDAVLAYELPKNAVLHSASIDNLGGDSYLLNVKYRQGANYTYIKTGSNTEDEDWKVTNAQSLALYGYGFWQGVIPGQTSGGTTGAGPTSSGNSYHSVQTDESGSYSSESGGLLLKLWEGELSSSAQLGASSEKNYRSFQSSDTESNDAGATLDQISTINSYERNQGSKRVWGLPELLLINSYTFGQSFDAYADLHVVQDANGHNVSLSGHSHSVSTGYGSFLEFGLIKINATGLGGLARKQISNAERTVTTDFTSSLSGDSDPQTTDERTGSSSDQLLWLGGEGAATEWQSFPLNSGLLDVFEDSFVTRTSVDTAELDPDDPDAIVNLNYAYQWDAAKTLKLSAYSSSFALLEEFEVSVLQADLQYDTNNPPTFYSASYHP